MSTATITKYPLLVAGLVSLILSGFGTSSSHAAVINGNFDTGDLTGWVTFGDVSTDGAQQASLKTINVDDNFAELEQFLDLEPGDLDTLDNGETFEGSAIKQTFAAEAGQILSFDWNFLIDEQEPKADFNDFAFVTINASLSELADTFSPSVTSPTPFARETGLQTFSYTIPSTGNYTLAMGVVDVNDPGVDAGLLVDNVAVVPEPASVVSILAFAAFGVGSTLKRKSKG